MSPVNWVAGSPVSGAGCCSSVLVGAPLEFLGRWSFLLVASPLGSSILEVLSRSALAAFFCRFRLAEFGLFIEVSALLSLFGG